MAMRFECAIESVGDTVLVCMRGALDAPAAGELRAQLGRLALGGVTHVVADLRRVEEIDGAGLAALDAVAELARGSSARFAVVPGPVAIPGDRFELLPGDPAPGSTARARMIARPSSSAREPVCDGCGERIHAGEELCWQRPDGSLVEACPPLVRDMITLWDERIANGALAGFYHRRCRNPG